MMLMMFMVCMMITMCIHDIYDVRDIHDVSDVHDVYGVYGVYDVLGYWVLQPNIYVSQRDLKRVRSLCGLNWEVLKVTAKTITQISRHTNEY